MYEIDPREVIKMPILTRHHEAGGNHERRSALRITVVEVACSVGTIRKNLRLQQPGTYRGQQPAFRANHPAWKRGDRQPDLPRFIEPVRLPALRLWASWRCEEPSHLWPKNRLSRTQQPFFRNLAGVCARPVI